MSELKIGVIGGSGLGKALEGHADGRRHEIDTPFGRPSDAIVEIQWEGLPVFFLSRHGPGHTLNPSRVPYRANIFALKQLGCTHIIASGAVGSLRDEFRPRELVVPDQAIDKTFRRDGTFFDRAAVHVELAEPFCPVLRRTLIEAGQGSGFGVQGSGEASRGSGGVEASGQGQSQANADPDHTEPRTLNPEPSLEPRTLNPEPSPRVHHRGCYVCMEGPAFSTRAESLMHRLWGGDLIGMTAMPEARLAREAEMSYALVALVTDYDCWKLGPQNVYPGKFQGPQPPAPAADPSALLREILANLETATQNAIRLIQQAVRLMATRQDELLAAPALNALKLAIWSDKSRIDPEEVRRLAPLWGKYFPS